MAIRLRQVYEELVSIIRRNGLCLPKSHLRKVLALFGDQEEQRPCEHLLLRLQLTILRLITAEFLHYNVFLTQASNTVLLNMMPQS